MDDTYSVKLQVDSSDLTMAAQQAQMIAMSSAMQSGSMGLNPVSSMAQAAMMQNSQASSSVLGAMSTPMSMGMGNPFQHMGLGNVTTPQGYLAGVPIGPEGARRTIPNIASGVMDYDVRSMVGSSMGNFIQNYFPSAGFLGISGGGNLNVPTYRANQMFVEKFAESIDTAVTSGQKFGTNALTLAGGIAAGSLALPLVAPAAIGALALGQLTDYGFNAREKYMDIGRYYRDATASVYRDKLGGGASAHKAAEFQRGFGKQVAKDDYLMRDDYQLLLQTGTELNLFASNKNADDTLAALKNISNTVKAMTAVGIQLKNMQGDLGLLTQIGINPSNNVGTNARFLGGVSAYAFSGNMTMHNMLEASAGGSPLYSGMGYAPRVGTMVHAQSIGRSGEAIRSGAMSVEDSAYYGGQTGMSNSQTRGLATLTSSPLGTAFMMGALRSPGFEKDMVKGKGGVEGLLSSNVLNMDPSTYSTLMYKLPEYSKDMNPNVVAMGQLSALANSMSTTMGRKISAGDLQNQLTRMGVSPDDSRVLMHQVENADKIGASMEESLKNSFQQKQIEVWRPPANIFTNPKLMMQKQMEYWLDPTIANWSGNSMERIGRWEEWLEHGIVGKLIHPETKHTFHRSKMEGGIKSASAVADMIDAAKKNKIDNPIYNAENRLDEETEIELDDRITRETEGIPLSSQGSGGRDTRRVSALSPAFTEDAERKVNPYKIKTILKNNSNALTTFAQGIEAGMDNTDVAARVNARMAITEADKYKLLDSAYSGFGLDDKKSGGLFKQDNLDKGMLNLSQIIHRNPKMTMEEMRLIQNDPTSPNRLLLGATIHAMPAGPKRDEIETKVLTMAANTPEKIKESKIKDLDEKYYAARKGFGAMMREGFGAKAGEDELSKERVEATRIQAMASLLAPEKRERSWRAEEGEKLDMEGAAADSTSLFGFMGTFRRKVHSLFDSVKGSSTPRKNMMTNAELLSTLTPADKFYSELAAAPSNAPVSENIRNSIEALKLKYLEKPDLAEHMNKVSNAGVGKLKGYLSASKGYGELAEQHAAVSSRISSENYGAYLAAIGDKGSEEIIKKLNEARTTDMSDEKFTEMMKGYIKIDPKDAKGADAMNLVKLMLDPKNYEGSVDKDGNKLDGRATYTSNMVKLGYTAKEADEEYSKLTATDKDGKYKYSAQARTGGAISPLYGSGGDQMVIDPKGGGKFLTAEVRAGFAQSAKDVHEMMELTSSISTSVASVPKSLNDFRDQFMDGFKKIADKFDKAADKIIGPTTKKPTDVIIPVPPKKEAQPK